MTTYDFDRFTAQLNEAFYINPGLLTGGEWKTRGQRKQHREHLLTDGHDSHDGNGTIISKNLPGVMVDGSSGQAQNVISYYAAARGLKWMEAAREVARMYDVYLPEEEETDETRARRERRQQRAAIITALSPRTSAQNATVEPIIKKVTEYLRARGITPEMEELWQIAYIGDDPGKGEILRLLQGEKIEDSRVGVLYDIVFPFFCNGDVTGVVLTTTRAHLNEYNQEQQRRGGKTAPKYLRYKFDRDDPNAHVGAMYGLHHAEAGSKTLVVCEGYFDVMAAAAALSETNTRDVAGIVSNNISSRQAREIRRAGYTHVILIPDYEGDKGQGMAAGLRATSNAIRQDCEALQAEGISVTAVNLQDDSHPDRKQDANSFICEFGKDEFCRRVKFAQYPEFLVYSLIEQAFFEENPDRDDTGNVCITPNDHIRAQRDFAQIVAMAGDNITTENELIRMVIPALFRGNEQAARRAVENAKKEQKEARDYKTKAAAQQAAADHYHQAAALIASGKRKQACEEIEAGRAAMEGNDAKYLHLLTTPTQEDLTRTAKTRGGQLPTGYILKGTYTEEEFSLPQGAITLIGGVTGHGKSTLLQNIALRIAKDDSTLGSVLYFSFEEDTTAVTLQFLNKFVNLPLCRNYNPKFSNNARAIEDYYKTGQPTYIAGKVLDDFKQKESEFFREIITPGRLRIFYEDYTAEELTGAILSLAKRINVKAVFVDFLQLLYSKEARARRMQRTEELKGICNNLKNVAISLNIPVVAAVQLNRETTSPTTLASQRVAEAADIERLAHKIVCVWNSSERPYKTEGGELRVWEQTHFVCGTPGILFAKLTKNRGGANGLEGLFNWDTNTGVIE